MHVLILSDVCTTSLVYSYAVPALQTEVELAMLLLFV